MAFLVHQDQLFYTLDETQPVGTLIEGIWTLFPLQARAITRNRIFTDRNLTPLCEGMLKVAAKRASKIDQKNYTRNFVASKNGKTTTEIFPLQAFTTPAPFFIEDRSYTIKEAMAVAKKLGTFSKLNIGAVLLDPEQKIVSWGWNNHEQNKILHAEILLVKNFLARSGFSKIPSNYTLISTLQPCAMCAGYLFQNAEHFPSFKVFYAEKDPGPFAQNSVLVPGSSLFVKAFFA